MKMFAILDRTKHSTENIKGLYLFDYRRLQIFWEVVGLERGPLSLMSTIEELLERKSSSSKSRKPRLRPYDIRCATGLYPQKLALTSSTSGDRSVYFGCGFRPQSKEFFFLAWEWFFLGSAHLFVWTRPRNENIILLQLSHGGIPFVTQVD
jgi:hypothetical protein